MVRWIAVCVVLAAVAAILGFTSIAAGIRPVASILFWLFAFAFVVLLFLSLFGRRVPRP